MAGKNSGGPADTSDREIVKSRLIRAPRELVFEAWTDPAHVDHWMGPNGFTTTTLSMDVRPGGLWRFVMRGMGMEFPNRVTYLEVVKPERLVYYHGGDSDEEARQMHVTVTFEQQGERTLLTMRSVFPSAAERDKVVKEYNAIEGGQQTLDRLEAHVVHMQGDSR
jgi:uncharacterized protein YndB with AHSA1/START domain